MPCSACGPRPGAPCRTWAGTSSSGVEGRIRCWRASPPASTSTSCTATPRRSRHTTLPPAPTTGQHRSPRSCAGTTSAARNFIPSARRRPARACSRISSQAQLMRLIPAIDLRAGRCVRLLQGDFATPRPPTRSRRPRSCCAAMPRLLRGAPGARRRSRRRARRRAQPATANNRALIGALVRVRDAVPALQVGGGLRSAAAAVEELHARGVARVVIGSAAVQRREVAIALVRALRRRACVPGLRCVHRCRGGAARAHARLDAAARRESMGCARPYLAHAASSHVLCTDIERDGTLKGPNLDLCTRGPRAPAAACMAGIGRHRRRKRSRRARPHRSRSGHQRQGSARRADQP